MGRRSVSTHAVARPLLMTDEVMALPAEEEIVQVGGLRPILATEVRLPATGLVGEEEISPPLIASAVFLGGTEGSYDAQTGRPGGAGTGGPWGLGR